MRTAKLSESSEAEHLLQTTGPSSNRLQPLGLAVFGCNLGLALLMLFNVLVMQEGVDNGFFFPENTTTETSTTVTTTTFTSTSTQVTKTQTTTPLTDVGRLAAETARREGRVLACGKQSAEGNASCTIPFIGVNVGGWLVMEDDLWPTEFKEKDIHDEWSYIHSLGGPKNPKAVKAMKDHWDTFITDKDLDELQHFGVTHVRIPVGYWLVDYKDTDGFVYRGQLYLFRFLAWLKQRNMKAVIVLQAAPGGQAAGTSSTGRRTWEPGFFMDEEMYERGKKAILSLAEWIVQMNENTLTENVIVGMELLNEPDWQYWSRKPGIRDLYETMVPQLRKVLPAEDCVFLLSFEEPVLDEGLGWLQEMRRKHPEDYAGVFYDAHISHVANPGKGAHIAEDTCKTCCRDPILLKPLELASVPAVIGQYSLATGPESHRPANEAYFRNQLSLWANLPGVVGSFFWNHRVLRSASGNKTQSNPAPGDVSPLSLLDLIKPGGPLDTPYNISQMDFVESGLCPDQDLDDCPAFDARTVTWFDDCEWS